MIIFSRTIKWKILKHIREEDIMASVNIDNQVHLDVGGHCATLSPQEAFALGRAIMHAALGEGVPAGPRSPFTYNE